MSACAIVCRDSFPRGDEARAGKSAGIALPDKVLQRSPLLLEQLNLSDSVQLPVTEEAAKAWVRVSQRLRLNGNDASLLKLSLKSACSLLEV
jgi:hypothetical protein